MIKLLLLAIVLYVVYIMFFRKSEKLTNRSEKKDTNIESLVECKGCGTFISPDEAIISNGKYYCSNQCLDR